MAFKNPSASSSSIIAVHELNTAGTNNYLFSIPTDVDSIVGKVWLDSTWSATGSALVYFQTTEDGGTTWRDVSVTSIGTNQVAAGVNNLNAHFIPIACISDSARGVSQYIGSVASSSLVQTLVAASTVGTLSGMPMMSTLGRISVIYNGTITTSGINVQVFAPTGELR